MMQSLEGAGTIGKDMMEGSMKSFAALSKSMQAIAVEATEYSKKSYETGTSAMEKLMSAKSLDKAFEIQSDYAKTAYESFVAEMTRMGELYSDMAKEAYKPLEGVATKAR